MYSEKQFAFSAAWKIAKFYEKALHEKRAETGLTQCEMDVLLFLNNEKTLNTSRDIAEHRSISKSLICKSVASLTEKEFITSTSDELDARVLRLGLTPKGQAIAVDLAKTCNSLTNNLFWGISDSEMQFLSNVYRKILQNGKKHYH